MTMLTREQIHKNMSAIHSLNTKPEMIVRRGLWRMGFRYRLNHKRLPGKPDLVLTKYRTCIFVNGCFWHGHNVTISKINDAEWDIVNSPCCRMPKTNIGFWVRKITRNQERDVEVKHKLNAMGWNCITVWECELKSAKREATLQSLAFTLNEIFLNNHKVRSYDQKEVTPLMAAESAFEYGEK